MAPRKRDTKITRLIVEPKPIELAFTLRLERGENGMYKPIFKKLYPGDEKCEVVDIKSAGRKNEESQE